jgi:hypothetical protein
LHGARRFLLSLMHLLQGDRDLSQRAWSYINDSMRTTACILFRPEAIAAAAVSLAARALGVALPDSPPWWTVLDVAEQGFVFVCVPPVLIF